MSLLSMYARMLMCTFEMEDVRMCSACISAACVQIGLSMLWFDLATYLLRIPENMHQARSNDNIIEKPHAFEACLEANAMILVGAERSTIKNGSFVDVRQYGSSIKNDRSVIDVGQVALLMHDFDKH